MREEAEQFGVIAAHLTARFEEQPSLDLARQLVDGFIVYWDKNRAILRTRNLAAVLRERGAREASGEVVEVGEFELALAHLRVPEMA